MAATKYPSPCCNAVSIVRRISMAERALVLRCTKCAMLRIHELATPPNEQPRPHLKLIHSR